MLLLIKIDFKRLLLGTIALFGIFQMLSAFSASYGMLMISRIGVACTHSVFWSIASPAAVSVVSEKFRSIYYIRYQKHIWRLFYYVHSGVWQLWHLT